MFRKATIHYPTDQKALAQIGQDIAAFRCAAAVKYIQSLHLNDDQLEKLYADLEGIIRKDASA